MNTGEQPFKKRTVELILEFGVNLGVDDLMYLLLYTLSRDRALAEDVKAAALAVVPPRTGREWHDFFETYAPAVARLHTDNLTRYDLTCQTLTALEMLIHKCRTQKDLAFLQEALLVICSDPSCAFPERLRDFVLNDTLMELYEDVTYYGKEVDAATGYFFPVEWSLIDYDKPFVMIDVKDGRLG